MTTSEGSAPDLGEARARYDGVPVWDRVEQPHTLIRNVRPDELLRIVDEAAPGWLRVRVADGAEAFVRADQLAMASPRSNTALGLAHPAAIRAPAADQAAGTAFPGARRVATGLTIFAWVTLVVGVLASLGALAADFCTESFIDDCSDEGASKAIAFVSVLTFSAFMALLQWAIAYGLLLLDRIQQQTIDGR